MGTPAEFWANASQNGGINIPKTPLAHVMSLSASHTWQTVLSALGVSSWPDEFGVWNSVCWSPDCTKDRRSIKMLFTTPKTDGHTQAHSFGCTRCKESGSMDDLVVAVMGFTTADELRYFYAELPSPTSIVR